LYVFYDRADLNTPELWLKSPESMVTRANAQRRGRVLQQHIQEQMGSVTLATAGAAE
jgi:hypothetical protein